MKKTFTLFILVLSLSFSYSQITFTSNDVMAVGTKVYAHKDTLSTITNPGNSGANQTWNYTGVATHVYDSIRALNPTLHLMVVFSLLQIWFLFKELIMLI